MAALYYSNEFDQYWADTDADKTGLEATLGNGAQVWVLDANRFYKVIGGAYVETVTASLTNTTQTINGAKTFANSIALGTNSITMTGSIGATGARVTKGWFTDIESSNMPTVGGVAILSSLTAPTFTTQTASDNSTKVATTAYVDNAVLGQRLKEAVKYASIAPLPSIVYANGASGVGATLTGVALAAISLDSSSPSVNDRVLIKNQVSTFQNGIYVVTQTGSGIAVFILTRAIDFDQAADIQTGDSVFVTAGNTLATTTWAYNGIDSPVMGTDALTFVQAAGPGSYTAGTGILITGVSISVDTSVTLDKTTVQTGITNKTFVAPVLGAATATSINGLIITTTTGTFTLASGKTLTVNNTLTLAGTDGTTMTFPTTSATLARTDAANTFTGASIATAWLLTSCVVGTSLVPNVDDGAALGSTSKEFSDLFLSEGGVINWDNGDATMTQSSDDITFAGITTFKVGTSTAVTLGTIELGAASDTTLARSSAGNMTIEGNLVYRAGGTDVPVTDGGTGVSTLAALSIWVANSADTITSVTPGAGNSIRINASGTAWEAFTPASASVPTTITVANEATDTTCFIGFFTAATGDLGPKTNTNMTFNSNTGVATFAGLIGNSFIPTSSTVPSNGVYLPAANTLGWAINSAAEMQLTATALSPAADGGNSLGTTALGWQNLFGNTGFVFNIENSDWVATHTAGILTVGTGDLRVTTAGTNTASVVTVGGTQTLTGKSIVATQLTGSAQTMAVNNTNGTAAYTTTPYYDIASQTYAGTPTWTGTTAPSGATTHRYVWTRFGNDVNLKIWLIYATNGSAVTNVVFPLPADCPAPFEPSGLGGANDRLYMGTGYIESNTTAVPGAARSYLKVNSGDTGWDLSITAGTSNGNYSHINIWYTAA